MNKKEVLKLLFQLPKEDILDIKDIINGYTERVNKSNKDTLLIRCLFAKGYKNSKDFYIDKGITRDNSLAQALNYNCKNIGIYLSLKDMLDIDDELFMKILREIGDDNENK